MVNHDEYRWKNMIGPRDRRPPYHGTWYRYSTNGWGIPDFMAFCEAAGFEYIPDFNIDESPQDMADFVEYAKGPVESAWGQPPRRRRPPATLPPPLPGTGQRATAWMRVMPPDSRPWPRPFGRRIRRLSSSWATLPTSAPSSIRGMSAERPPGSLAWQDKAAYSQFAKRHGRRSLVRRARGHRAPMTSTRRWTAMFSFANAAG